MSLSDFNTISGQLIDEITHQFQIERHKSIDDDGNEHVKFRLRNPDGTHSPERDTIEELRPLSSNWIRSLDPDPEEQES